uniref:Uncharacterized protein n=1 Tax=Candidatus Methanophagaceae archaeon ANME-1 ERB6 TaxID=2759912 RepID=A0A7G9YVI0_9EURY|nr:hypothetical protein HGMICNAC_00016 [Methanosarcinales archaeon ANME-1 ERB6]
MYAKRKVSMDGDSQNPIQIKTEAHSVIERLSKNEIELILPLLEHVLRKEKVVSSAEEGWRAFMEMGEDGLGSKLHNASEEHDKYLYQDKVA